MLVKGESEIRWPRWVIDIREHDIECPVVTSVTLLDL